VSYAAASNVVPFDKSTSGERYDRGPTIEQYAGDLDKLHAKAIKWFEEAERATHDEREYAKRDRDYVCGDQWTTPERDALRKRGQPEITINYCSRKVNLLMGLERKARTDPKAYPRTPTEEEKADAATQALRYISDSTNFHISRSEVYSNMLVEGCGAVELDLEDDGNGGADVTITHVQWDRLWWDPHSSARDFSDARHVGLVIWLDRDQLDEMYPGKEDLVDDTFRSHTGNYDDRPGVVNWTDSTRHRVRIAQVHWVEKGTWWKMTFSRMGVLAEPEPSKFKDARNDSACSLVMQSSYIDRENRRYGMVRDLISMQDELNKRRSKALHLLSVSQVVTETGAVSDEDHARREVARPDGFIVVTPGMRFDVDRGGDLAAGQFQLLQHATAEIQASGPNASMSGTDPRELSGRAILAQQAGGTAQNEPLADALRMWSRRVYEMAWMAAREHWTAGKWVRVTDDFGATRWVGINQPVRLMDALAKMPKDQMMQAVQGMQLQPGDPRLQQVIKVENDISDLDVDIVVEEGIDVPTQQAEQFQILVQMAGMQPGLIPPDVLIAASGLKNKDDLLKRMEQHQQQAAQKQAQIEPIQHAGAVAEVQAKQAKAEADQALAQERRHGVVQGMHDMHAQFSAPPYGQPNVDEPVQPQAPPAQPPAQMPPELQALHDMADLRVKNVQGDVHHATVLHKLAQAHAAMQPKPPPAKR